MGDILRGMADREADRKIGFERSGKTELRARARPLAAINTWMPGSDQKKLVPDITATIFDGGSRIESETALA
jgi:hypothetical protein